jgi:hypothetical protein
MITMGVSLAIVAWGGGVYMGVVFCDFKMESIKTTHKKEMDEIFEEVTRCRAQVAALIGKT